MVKKAVYNELVWNVNTINTSGLVKNTDYDAKISDIEGKMPSTIGLAITASLDAVEYKIPNASDLVIEKQIMMQKYQTLKKNILLLMIIINLRVKWLVQR